MSDEPAPPPEEPKMEFHKPKPIHSWRELLTEIGVVVIGVCIALAAEQGVEWLRWRHEAAAANEAIATELAYNLGGAIQRLRTEKCVEARLDVLSTILDEAVKKGSLPPLGEIGKPPSRLWRSGVWEGVVTSQVVTHFSRERQANLGTVYKVVDRLNEDAAAERTVWNDLYAMSGPGRRIDPYAENLRQALSRARSLNRYITSLSTILLERVHELGLPFSQDDLARIAATRSQTLTGDRLAVDQVNAMSFACGPIGPVAPTYGQGPAGGMSALMDDAVKAIPDFSAGAR